MKKVIASDSRCAPGETQAAPIYSVDSFAGGIAFGQHNCADKLDPREPYYLRLQNDRELIPLRSRYSVHKHNPLHELEQKLMKLSSQGILQRSIIYFGTTTDPFFPFEGKFDASIKFLEMFRRYKPGLLIVQTRSPLVVIALPILTGLGQHCSVTIAVETPLEEVAQRYTPALPRINERLRTAMALRRFGVPLTLQVAPLVPYGDWTADAPRFAETLCEHADYVFIRSITDGSEAVERKIRGTQLAKKLAQDRKFHWLRPDSAKPLTNALENICPDKLRVPTCAHLKERQLSIFAA